MAVQGETIVIFGYETGLRSNGVNSTTSSPYSLPKADLTRFLDFHKRVNSEHASVEHPDLNDPVALSKFVGDYHLTRTLISTGRMTWIETSVGTIQVPVFLRIPNIMMDDGNVGEALDILKSADTGSYQGTHIAHPDNGSLVVDLDAERIVESDGE